jgi:hypothetical protein
LRDKSEFAIIPTCAPPGELALKASHSIGGDSCFEERHAKEAEAAVAAGNTPSGSSCVLHVGVAINCLGRRVTSYTTRDAKEIAKLLAMVP